MYFDQLSDTICRKVLTHVFEAHFVHFTAVWLQSLAVYINSSNEQFDFLKYSQRAFIETYITYPKYILTDNSKFDLLTEINTFQPKLIAVCLSHNITFANVVLQC